MTKSFKERKLEEFDKLLVKLGRDILLSKEEAKHFLSETIDEAIEKGREEEFDTEVNKAETEAKIAQKAYADGYNDCKKGRKKAPHDTRDGYCCACDYDLACFEQKLKSLSPKEEK